MSNILGFFELDSYLTANPNTETHFQHFRTDFFDEVTLQLPIIMFNSGRNKEIIFYLNQGTLFSVSMSSAVTKNHIHWYHSQITNTVQNSKVRPKNFKKYSWYDSSLQSCQNPLLHEYPHPVDCLLCSLHCCSKLGCKVWRGMAVVWAVVGCVGGVRQRMAGAERWAGRLYWYTMVSYW